MQVGNILKFGLDHMPFVRGVHFQPISYFGRCSQKRPQNPITIPKMLRLIEEQTEGLMKIEDFAGGGRESLLLLSCKLSEKRRAGTEAS